MVQQMGQRIVMLAVALAGLAGATATADQNSGNLDPLFRELARAEYPIQAQQLANEIWTAWHDSGDAAVNRELQAGIRAMNGGRLETAIERFSQVVEMAPEFAEGWNKRATAHYLNDQPVASMRDIQQTLSLEPRHFGALSGMGLIFLQQGDERAALEAFEEVLRIYPASPGTGQRVEQLRRKLDGQQV